VIARLLVANRGEIALRIIRACREMGIESVAIYSDADARAAHVVAADVAIPIGPAPPAASYLSTAKILEAARSSGADAVHPGYGFLSENAAFAEACERAGLIFVGPPSQVIARMGSKINARQTMTDAGVPVVPGIVPEDQSDAGLQRAIEQIGLPALIKASSGGGGKGMRAVAAADEIVSSVQAARREALAAFGSETLYVERQIARPHHVEVQILADHHGQVVHVFERECSVQRRHQKVIEESPSPNVTPGLRQRITAAAVQAARASGYRNAGTVEFLVDLAGGHQDVAPFYFLEMNTRLQVEHGITEQVAGVDLVHAQLQIASGAPLAWSQEQLSQRGHAIEARVYAEDANRGFLPQAGRLLLYREPVGPGIRIDSGVREGDDVSVYYDPLLAKVIASAETRDLAIARLAAALRAFPVLGLRTNIPFLLRVLAHDRFRSGTVDTGWLDTEGASLSAVTDPEPSPFIRAALDAATSMPAQTPVDRDIVAWDPWDRLRGWRTS
jgi:acetyl-CoA carboxylase biotin carboxylase subunit